MAIFNVSSCEILHDGRVLTIRWTANAPSTSAIDWLPGFVAGKRITLSTGADLTFMGGSTDKGCAVWTLATSGGANGQTFRIDLGGGHITADIVYSSTLATLGANIASAINTLLDSVYGVTAFHVRCSVSTSEVLNYFSFDGPLVATTTFPTFAKVAPGAGTPFAGVFTPTKIIDSTGLTTWITHYEIADPADRITYGQGGVTASADVGLLQDSLGNSTAAFGPLTITNYSYVGADGFLSSSVPVAGVTVYCSYTYGNDAVSFANGQNPLTPYRTLGAALSALRSNGHGGDGSRALMLQGDTDLSAAQEGMLKGSAFIAPFQISTYWNAFGGIDPSWQGKRAIIRPPAAGGNGLTTYSTSGPYVIISGIHIENTVLDASAAWVGFNLGDNGTRKDHTCFIDCKVTRAAGWIIQPLTGGHHISIIRCIGCDSAQISGHNQGVFTAYMERDFLISETVLDQNGRKSGDLTKSDVFCRNVYLSSASPGTHMADVVYTRSWNTRSGSEGGQFRNGGAIFRSVFSNNIVANWLNGMGGRIAQCISLDSVIGAKPDTSSFGGDNGFYVNLGIDNGDFAIIGGSSIVEQNVLARAATYTIGLGFVSNYKNVAEVITRNNTSVVASILSSYTFPGNQPREVYQDRNVIDAGGATDPYCVYVTVDFSPSWFFTLSDQNVFYNTNAARLAYAGADITFAQWKVLTGDDVATSQTQPTYPQGDADLGDWAVQNGFSNSITALITELRNRELGQWRAVDRAEDAVVFFQTKYRPSNFSTSEFTGPLGMRGAPVGLIDLSTIPDDASSASSDSRTSASPSSASSASSPSSASSASSFSSPSSDSSSTSSFSSASSASSSSSSQLGSSSSSSFSSVSSLSSSSGDLRVVSIMLDPILTNLAINAIRYNAHQGTNMAIDWVDVQRDLTVAKAKLRKSNF